MREASDTKAPAGVLHYALWMTQILLALTFVGGGLFKAFAPIEVLAAAFPWAGQVPSTFVRFTALLDVLGGLGVVLPSLTRIAPLTTVAAAIGCVLLQLSAIAFHVSRGEAAATPFNVVLVVLSAFVAWGRLRGAPIAAR